MGHKIVKFEPGAMAEPKVIPKPFIIFVFPFCVERKLPPPITDVVGRIDVWFWPPVVDGRNGKTISRR